jgi:dolichol-phosphate hexosyltransferase
MLRGKTISLVIPCMNERKGLEQVFPFVPSCVDEVVIVDYKSTDGTPEFAKSKGARVFHENIRGYGAAYKRGLKEARGDIIVTGDGDGTYPISSIPEMVNYLLDNDLDFISGCRFPLKDQKSMRKRNYVGNMIITSIAVMLFGYKVTDVLSGMWVLRRGVLPHLRLTSDGWCFSEEIKIEAIHREAVKFREYHIDYFERSGQTKLWPFNVGVQNVSFLFFKKFRLLVERFQR